MHHFCHQYRIQHKSVKKLFFPHFTCKKTYFILSLGSDWKKPAEIAVKLKHFIFHSCINVFFVAVIEKSVFHFVSLKKNILPGSI
jgi:hypothetical protein